MTTHHYPAASGSTPSIIAPHMHVLGGHRAMLSDDVRLAAILCRTHEDDLADALVTWQHSRGDTRAVWRHVVRLCVARFRRWRAAEGEAMRRLWAYRP